MVISTSGVQFELPTVEGETFRFVADGKRWTFITLTALSCGDCVARQELDHQAMAAVQKRGGRSLALFLFGDASRAARFAESHPSPADQVLVDPRADVGVKQLKGSDSACWLLIAPDGSLAWQGEPDLEKLLSRLPQ